jgi:hypothetical protein
MREAAPKSFIENQIICGLCIIDLAYFSLFGKTEKQISFQSSIVLKDFLISIIRNSGFHLCS